MATKEYPVLETQRLELRAFTQSDAPVVAQLCGAWEIAETTASIPHPYEQSMAEAWIESHRPAFERGDSVAFAITRVRDARLVGAVDIHINKSNRMGEIGYWIGVRYWNRGYATEAVQAVIDYGFNHLGLNRIHARHMTNNPASGRVLQKAGMRLEGILRQSIFRWDSFEDAAMYSILCEEYEGAA
jgi:RimJ/RimL family protein N-acetyltransferase